MSVLHGHQMALQIWDKGKLLVLERETKSPRQPLILGVKSCKNSSYGHLVLQSQRRMVEPLLPQPAEAHQLPNRETVSVSLPGEICFALAPV